MPFALRTRVPRSGARESAPSSDRAVPSPVLRALAITVAVGGVAGSAFALMLLQGLHSSASAAGRALPAWEHGPVAISCAATLLQALLSLLILWRAGDRIENAMLGLAIGAIAFNDGIISIARIAEPPWAEAVILVTYTLGGAAFLRATQLFPRPLAPEDFSELHLPWTRLRALRRILVAFLRPAVIWLGVAPLLLLGVITGASALNEGLRLAVLALGAVYAHTSYRAADAEGRRKIFWFLEAVLLTLFVALVGVALGPLERVTGLDVANPVVHSVLDSLVRLGVTACFAAAIFYAGAVSPALVVQKTLVYGALTLCLVFLYTLLQEFAVGWIVTQLGVTSEVAAGFAGAGAGLACESLSNAFKRLAAHYVPAAEPHGDAAAASAANHRADIRSPSL